MKGSSFRSQNNTNVLHFFENRYKVHTTRSKEVRNNYKRFFTYLQYVLPCEECRKNYVKHFNKLAIDPYLNSADTLFDWILAMHNLVNTELNKPILKRKDIYKKYFNELNIKEGFSVNKKCDIILLVGLLMFLFYNK